ncbi:MAG: dihydrolipoyl dehydrogenase [Thermacetogeniaceae bacterium]
MYELQEIEVQLAVLGGGPAGYVAAIRGAQLGATVALIEEREIGGTCLNRGCIPTKALLRSSEVAGLIRRSKEFGIVAEIKGTDWATALARKDRVVKNLRMGLEHLISQNRIQLVRGHGVVENKNRIVVKGGAAETAVSCNKLIIATGSEPLLPDLPGIGLPGVITSDDALELPEIPESVLIIGAGAVGLEFATIFNKFGSAVTVVELENRILPREDPEVAGELLKIMKRKGIRFWLGARVREISQGEGGLTVTIEADGTKTLTVDKVLVAVGRKLNTSDDLLTLGLQMEKGRIVVNERMETSIDGVYAAGDVVGGKLLAHLAFAEGRVAAQNALGNLSSLDYDTVPSCVYTDPEVASVGLSEEEAKRRGIEVAVGRFYFRSNGRAQCLGEREGLVKVVVDRREKTVLGAQILGANAAELISELTLAVTLKAKADLLADMIHPHPTLSEAVMEACGDALGRSIHGVRPGGVAAEGHK